MRIDSLNETLAPDKAPAAPPSPQDEFLKLFVAQLKHQDPLNPQDGAAFVAQLAQFASLEQSAETNKHLSSLESGQSAASRASLASLLGREVLANAGQVTYDPTKGGPPVLSVNFSQPVTGAELVITDGKGTEVRTVNIGPAAAGETPIAWDGKDSQGAPLAAGTYHFEVRAKDSKGTAVTTSAQVRGVISQIDFSSGNTIFRVGSVTVTPADILALDTAATATTNQ